MNTNLPWAVVQKGSSDASGLLGTYPSRSAARANKPANATVIKTDTIVPSTISSDVPTATSVKRPPRAPRTGTKKERAAELVRGLARKDALEVLQRELGMSKVTANTYFYLVR